LGCGGIPYWVSVIMVINEVSGSNSLVYAAGSVNQLKRADVAAPRSFAAIDVEQFLRQCLGNMSLAASLLNMFEESIESRLASFDVALVEHRNDAIAHAAHALKGVAGILAANKLTDVCAELESAAEVADRVCIQSLIEVLHHEMQRVLSCIHEIRALGLLQS
jgi:HPt (histidine-containing phosphotransfer) domain-containing protein